MIFLFFNLTHTFLRRVYQNTGGLDAILRAMRVMKNSVSVQARGCAALGNLALVDSMSRATIAAKGGVGLILDARGRPIALPESRDEARDVVESWYRELNIIDEGDA